MATEGSRRKRIWNEILEKVEKDFLKDMKFKKNYKVMPIKDYAITLPLETSSQVKELVAYPYEIGDQNVFLGSSSSGSSKLSSITSLSAYEISDVVDDVNLQQHQRSEEKKILTLQRQIEKDVDFKESQTTIVDQMEAEYPHFDLRLEEPMEIKWEKRQKYHWLSSFIYKKRKYRVTWDSVLYPPTNTFAHLSLNKKADYLMEVCSAQFAIWLNSLTSDRTEHIGLDLVKNLFSVDPEQIMLNSVKCNPKEIKVIAKEIAGPLGVPQMALETKYYDGLKHFYKFGHEKKKFHVFGSTIPARNHPWQPVYPESYKVEKFFPDELLSGEVLFKGIGHLKSTNKFIDFCIKNPKIKRPTFLTESNAFVDHKPVTTVTYTGDTLYDRLHLEY